MYIYLKNEYDLKELQYKLFDYYYTYNLIPIVVFEEEGNVYDDEEIWISSSWISYNICHFLDNMFLYNIQNDDRNPPMNHLIMADFNPQTAIPYNNMMLKMMINNYNKPFKTTFQSDLSKLLRKSKKYKLCYKTVHVYIRSVNRGFPAVFRNYIKGKQYRDDGYRYLKINSKEKRLNEKNDIFITIIYRRMKERPRNITNIKLIKSMIKCLGYNYIEINFENKTPFEQIKSIMNSRIIITPIASGTINIIWLLSSKCVIIDCMSTYIMMDFSYFSYSLNYKYIPLFSLFHHINPTTFDEGYSEKLKFEKHPSSVFSVHIFGYYPLYKTSGNNMTISLKQIGFSLRYSLNT